MLAVTHDCYDVGKCIGQTLYLTCSRQGESTTIVCPLEHDGHKFFSPARMSAIAASLTVPSCRHCVYSAKDSKPLLGVIWRGMFSTNLPPNHHQTHTHTKIENLVDMVQKYYSDGIALYSLCIKQRRVCPPKSFHYSMFIWDFACGSQCVRIHCCIVSASNQVN